MSTDVQLIVFNPERISVEDIQAYVTPVDFVEITDQVLAQFEKQSVIGAKLYQQETPGYEDAVWVGEMSWIKASMGDTDKYIPAAVQHFFDVYESSGAVKITEELIDQLLIGFTLPSESVYETHEGYAGVAKSEDVEAFLRKHLGSWTFIDNW